MGEKGKVKLELLQYFHRNDISVGLCKIRFGSDWIRLNENVNFNFFPDLGILPCSNFIAKGDISYIKIAKLLCKN